jgi:N-acetyl-anhydromuramyl-L-alanine amidase AmpD
MATIYREGSTNRAVNKLIQKVLRCYPDGVWGKRTTECLKAWQKAHGLTPDGLVGPATLAKMGLTAAVNSLTINHKPLTINHGGVVLKKSKRRIDYIAVHCTATPEGQAKTVEQIRAEHKKQGWSDIGYHYIIDLQGRVHLGRDVDISGSHVSGYNSYSIGVVYVGGLENNPKKPYNELKAKDTRTDAQKAALLSLLMDLRKLYPNAKIQGHRDFSKDKNGNGIIDPWERIKDCPSFDAKTEYRKV